MSLPGMLHENRKRISSHSEKLSLDEIEFVRMHRTERLKNQKKNNEKILSMVPSI